MTSPPDVVSSDLELARLLSAAERGERIEPDSTGERQPARVVGFVGAPGAGKSTLIGGLIAHARAVGESVVVLAVDPSSPLTGGAFLGDRVRLGAHLMDDGVFVRSFATRGHPGGLVRALPAAITAASNAGWSRVIVEPVGGGQADVGMAELADTVVLVLTPEGGDEIQAMKAGILEFAHVVVVNKADRPEADHFVAALRRAWHPPPGGALLAVSARTGDGVAELFELLRAREQTMPRRVIHPVAPTVAAIEARVAGLLHRHPELMADVDGTDPDAVLRAIVAHLARQAS